MRRYFLLLLVPGLLSSCIGEDIIDDQVDERSVVGNPVTMLEVESMQNGAQNAFNSAPGNIFANNIEYGSVGGELNVALADNFGLSPGAAGAFSGRLIAVNPSFTEGIYYTLR